MFKYGCNPTDDMTRSRRSGAIGGKGWRATALWALLGASAANPVLSQGPTLGPAPVDRMSIGAPSTGELTPVSSPRPELFPTVVAQTPDQPYGGGVGLQPVQHSRRGPNPAMDRHIASMPNEYKDLEVIHHRSQLVLSKQMVRRFAITDPGIIEIVQYSPTEFAIIGNNRGTTDLMIWFEGEEQPLMYLVTVIPDPSLEERRRIDYGRIERKLALLYPNSKVYLIPMSRKVVVRGQARDAEESARIMQIVRGEVLTQDGALFGGYTNGADVTGNNVAGGFNNNGLGGGDLLSSLIVNELQVPGEFQVQVRVRIAELNRSMLRDYGINWNSIIEISGDQIQFGSNLGGGNVLSFTGIFENFTINTLIRALASNGTVKIMEDAAITTLAGEPAAFLSGGEFAVPSIVGLNGVGVGTTTFRGFGTSVIVTPTLVDHDLIRLQIVPELSQTTAQNSVGGIPGLNVKRVQTRVELREGQTIVLGGLFERQTNVEQTRIPFLGELPIVGAALFHSKRATEDEKELLIVVTPEIVRPLDADQTPPLPGWYVTHPDDVDFYKLSRTEGNPDLGNYQLLPYGNGQGYARDSGFNLYNPPPASGRLGPQPNGGAYAMSPGGPAIGGPTYGGPAYGAPGGAYPAPGGYAPGSYGPGAYGPGYGSPQDPYASGYTPVPVNEMPPLAPQSQYGPLPTPAPVYTPPGMQPTPALAPMGTTYRPQPVTGIQQTGGYGQPGPARRSPQWNR